MVIGPAVHSLKIPAAGDAAGFLRVIGPSPRGRCGRRDALHARAGGTIEPRRGTGTGPGRPYRPPLHAPAAGSGCRGAFYMRPGRTAGIGRLSVIATRSWRHVGMPPYARSGQGTALHAAAGGPMWASPPTMGGVRCTRGLCGIQRSWSRIWGQRESRGAALPDRTAARTWALVRGLRSAA